MSSLGVSILAHCFSRRFHAEELSTLYGWRALAWPRACVLLMFFDSWAFLFTSESLPPPLAEL